MNFCGSFFLFLDLSQKAKKKKKEREREWDIEGAFDCCINCHLKTILRLFSRHFFHLFDNMLNQTLPRMKMFANAHRLLRHKVRPMTEMKRRRIFRAPWQRKKFLVKRHIINVYKNLVNGYETHLTQLILIVCKGCNKQKVEKKEEKATKKFLCLITKTFCELERKREKNFFNSGART